MLSEFLFAQGTSVYTAPVLSDLLHPLHLSCDNFSSVEVLPYEEMVQATIELAASNNFQDNHVTGFIAITLSITSFWGWGSRLDIS